LIPGVVDANLWSPDTGLDEVVSLLLQKFQLEVTSEATLGPMLKNFFCP
jgi:hypothetical protein